MWSWPFHHGGLNKTIGYYETPVQSNLTGCPFLVEAQFCSNCTRDLWPQQSFRRPEVFRRHAEHLVSTAASFCFRVPTCLRAEFPHPPRREGNGDFSQPLGKVNIYRACVSPFPFGNDLCSHHSSVSARLLPINSTKAIKLKSPHLLGRR